MLVGVLKKIVVWVAVGPPWENSRTLERWALVRVAVAVPDVWWADGWYSE